MAVTGKLSTVRVGSSSIDDLRAAAYHGASDGINVAKWLPYADIHEHDHFRVKDIEIEGGALMTSVVAKARLRLIALNPANTAGDDVEGTATGGVEKVVAVEGKKVRHLWAIRGKEWWERGMVERLKHGYILCGTRNARRKRLL